MPQPPRGAGHMLFFGDGDEIAQMTKFHCSPMKTKNISISNKQYILHI
jgi:hypothetical protein